MTIAWKTVGDPSTASGRYRAFIPCRHLREAGWQCEIYQPSRAAHYELVIFQKVYDEDAIRLVGELRSRGVKTVFDLCDNHYHYELDNPEGARNRADRLNRMIEAVDAVSVSTPALVEVVEKATGRSAVIIDDAVEVPRLEPLSSAYHALRARLVSGWRRSLRIVWYGIAGGKQPPFGMIDLKRVLPSLEILHREIPLSLTVISNSRSSFREYANGASFPVRYEKWRQDSFPHVFAPHDVCVIPVNPNPFTLCKTSNRVITSLLLGVPVVADRIPSYEEFSGFILFSEWVESLRAYATDPAQRERHVEQGRHYIRSRYDRDRVVSQWSSLFRSLAVS
jgi:hypothetical protein